MFFLVHYILCDYGKHPEPKTYSRQRENIYEENMDIVLTIMGIVLLGFVTTENQLAVIPTVTASCNRGYRHRRPKYPGIYRGW